MSRKFWLVIALLALMGGMVSSVGRADEEPKKKISTKVVMMVALSENEPKKGEMESWKEKTTALVVASRAAVDGNADAGMMLTKAANCKARHTSHK
jgi:hypothetical protein